MLPRCIQTLHNARQIFFKHISSTSQLRTQNAMSEERKLLTVSHEDILQAQNKSDILIIDVREQHEIDETGKLPGSIHIPMADVANILAALSEQDFKAKYDKPKPSKETKIILSCRSGKRSGIVQEEIQKLGYENAYNYTGGWLDWESKQKSS